MSQEGKYLTSFLEIYVNTQQELNNLAELQPEHQGTYYHEYLHYIQDITTCSGLSKIWHCFDGFRQLVASIQSQEITDVEVPLTGETADLQKENRKFHETIRGSGQINGVTPEVADTYRIVNVELQDDARIPELFPDSSAQKIMLNLSSQGRNDKVFTFGEAAISETMAYLIERKFYPDLNQLPKYPYQVAHDFVEFCYPELLGNHENLFALCDISLLHNLPGWAFYQIMNEMKKSKFTPNDSREVVNYGYQFYETIKWDFTNYMRIADESVQHISSQLFQNPHFGQTKLLLQASIERGRILRESCPYAVLDIYKSDTALSHSFFKVFDFLGGPHAINFNGDRVVRVPSGLDMIFTNVHPQHFRVIWQLHKFLTEGERSCSLQKICLASNNSVNVDDRCEDFPWKRAQDDMGCPYASFWAMYGFHLKNFYLDGNLIQQAIH